VLVASCERPNVQRALSERASNKSRAFPLTMTVQAYLPYRDSTASGSCALCWHFNDRTKSVVYGSSAVRAAIWM
jgi:hypothetical protein